MALLKPNKHGIYCFCRENEFVLLVVRWKWSEPDLWYYEEYHMNGIGQSMLWDQDEFENIDDAVDHLCNEKSEESRVIYW